MCQQKSFQADFPGNKYQVDNAGMLQTLKIHERVNNINKLFYVHQFYTEIKLVIWQKDMNVQVVAEIHESKLSKLVQVSLHGT